MGRRMITEGGGMELLPDEVFACVIGHLALRERWRLRAVSRRWQRLVQAHGVQSFSTGMLEGLAEEHARTLLEALGQFEGLRRVVVDYVRATDLEWIAHCPYVTHLTVRGARSLASLVVGETSFSSLVSLDVRDSLVLDPSPAALLEVLQRCPRLEQLRLGYLEEREAYSFGRGLLSTSQVAPVCPSLRQLHVFGPCFVVDQLPAQLTHLTARFVSLSSLRSSLSSLSSLDLRGARQLPVAAFDRCSQLTAVSLSCAEVYPLSLGNLLAAAPLLSSLDLCYAPHLSSSSSFSSSPSSSSSLLPWPRRLVLSFRPPSVTTFFSRRSRSFYPPISASGGARCSLPPLFL